MPIPSGRWWCRPAYDDAADFGNGHAVVGRKAGDGRMLYGLIDRSGRVVVPLEWERLGGVRNGVCVARTGTAAEREFLLADTLGNVRSLGYDYCSDFSNGLARVGVGAYVEKENVAGITLRDAYEFCGKFGYIAPDGGIVIPVQFDDARDFAQDGWPRSAFRENTMSNGGSSTSRGDRSCRATFTVPRSSWATGP